MLLMFVVGTGSVGWMLTLGALMALEKNAPLGRPYWQAAGRWSARLGSHGIAAQRIDLTGCTGPCPPSTRGGEGRAYKS
jgi:hypothetical protein